MPTIWTAGHNMPGYLPEGDIAAFETRKEALDYAVEEMRQAAERQYEIDSGDGENDVFGTEYDLAAESLASRDADTDGDWYETFEDGRIAYWFQSIDVTEEEAREALEGEN